MSKIDKITFVKIVDVPRLSFRGLRANCVHENVNQLVLLSYETLYVFMAIVLHVDIKMEI